MKDELDWYIDRLAKEMAWASFEDTRGRIFTRHLKEMEGRKTHLFIA